MPITLTPIAYLLRGGPEHHSVEDKDPYIASGVVTVVANVAYVSGACGEVSPGDYFEAFDWLFERGFAWVEYEHKGRDVVVTRERWRQ
jgi:hypothetical protein